MDSTQSVLTPAPRAGTAASTVSVPSPTPYRVNTRQRVLLVLGMVAIAFTLIVSDTHLAAVALDVVAIVVGLGAWETASRVREEVPSAPWMTLGLGPTVMAGNHVKTALAMHQVPAIGWISLLVMGTALILTSVGYVLWSLIREHNQVNTSNLVLHHLADLMIIAVSTFGGLLVIQYAPLRASGIDSLTAFSIMMSNVGLVCLVGTVVIGRSRIPGVQLGLAIAVTVGILGDLVIAQASVDGSLPMWTITAFRSMVCLPLLIVMTMCNPREGFSPRFILEPTNTLRAGLIGLWVVLFLILPFLSPLHMPVSTWSILVSAVMALLAIRMWTLIGERDHKLQERNARQHQFRHKISHDALTDLMLRSVMKERFYAARVGLNNPAVLTFFRAKGLDTIRDKFGHEYAETAIKLIAQTIAEPAQGLAEVFRFRRHEFIMIFTPPTGIDDAEIVVADAVKRIRRLTFDNGQPVGAYVHVGMVKVDTNRDFEDAIRWCEVAVDDRKERRSTIVRVAHDHIAQVAHVTLTDQRLREALRNDAFTLVMQPVMDTTHHYCVGFEAFARWKNNDLAPTTFVRSLEQVGLADSFGRWVLHEATQFAAEANCPISVNVSISHIQNSSFVMDVRSALDRSGIPPELLTIEFSEQDLSIDLTRLIMTLNQVRDLGVRIAIDDVGIGGLTLAQLSRLPVETMKIDQSLISKAQRYEDSRHLLYTVIHAASQLGLDIVAEGVETNDVLNMVIDGGCTQAQGWLWTKELTRSDAIHWWSYLGTHRGGTS